MRSAALATTKATGALVATNLPITIRSAIADLRIAFSAGAPKSDDDRVRELQLYAEAVEGFPPFVAAEALKRLRRHNPRNPFPPTPQDIFEECNRTRTAWWGRVSEFFIGSGTWDAAAWGPRPHEPGCFVSDEQILEFLKHRLAYPGDRIEWDLLQLSDARFDAVPEEAFPPGERASIVARRRARLERANMRRVA